MSGPTPSLSGELLKLGPPATGTVLITVDSRQPGAPFTAAVQNLFPGGELPVHRMRDWTEVWVVLKGQGRVTLGDRVTTVVHGAVLSVPAQTWFGLRNTGNGPLQAVVVSAPAGVDQLFRELSNLGAAPDPAAVTHVAARYGVEFRQGGEAAAPPGERGRHRRRRGGRGRGGRTEGARAPAPQSSEQAEPPAPPAAPVVSLPAQGDQAVSQPAGEGRGGGRRRHRRRGRRGGGTGGAAHKPSAVVPQPHGQAQTSASAPASHPHAGKSHQPKTGRPKRRERQRYSRHFKEVYMNGKWVQVSGEGPVIASGDQGDRHHQVDEEGPGGPLSVSL
jgi:mannose-6-phosphate isomerase-like protein (cupin superfamily)